MDMSSIAADENLSEAKMLSDTAMNKARGQGTCLSSLVCLRLRDNYSTPVADPDLCCGPIRGNNPGAKTAPTRRKTGMKSRCNERHFCCGGIFLMAHSESDERWWDIACDRNGDSGALRPPLGPRYDSLETLSAVLPLIKPWDANAWEAPTNGKWPVWLDSDTPRDRKSFCRQHEMSVQVTLLEMPFITWFLYG
jgi:hypothetical protein